MMRVLAAILTCLTYSAATWGSPWLPPVRDGVWLQNGIHQQQRWNAHETLSDKDINDATLVTSYVCGVVDFEKELVQRAAQLSDALQEGKKKKHLDPRMLEGMTQAVPILVPLLKSDFTTDAPSCDKALVIVRDYLAKYPEMLDKNADAIVEKALLANYNQSADP
jgi:hypothetical protein